jgi:hypothetical protein
MAQSRNGAMAQVYDGEEQKEKIKDCIASPTTTTLTVNVGFEQKNRNG